MMSELNRPTHIVVESELKSMRTRVFVKGNDAVLKNSEERNNFDTVSVSNGKDVSVRVPPAR